MDIYGKGLITALGESAVIAAASVPLVLRKVPINRYYGYRSRKTLADEFIWYEANAHMGRWLIATSAISAFGELYIYHSATLMPSAFIKATLTAIIAPAIVSTIATMLYVHKLTYGEGR